MSLKQTKKKRRLRMWALPVLIGFAIGHMLSR